MPTFVSKGELNVGKAKKDLFKNLYYKPYNILTLQNSIKEAIYIKVKGRI